jgi:hypothetical protein
MADAVRKNERSREIYCGDAVAPNSKAHCSGGGRVEERGGGVCSQAEEVNTVNDGHRERDKEQQQEGDKRQKRRYDPEHPDEASLEVNDRGASGYRSLYDGGYKSRGRES